MARQVSPLVRAYNYKKISKFSEFIGKGATIDEQDGRSLSLSEVDLNRVFLETFFNNEEIKIKGEERFERIKKADHIRLDVRFFLALWEKLHLIPKSWAPKEEYENRYVHFDGTIFRSADGYRFSLCLCLCSEMDRVGWGYRLLWQDWRSNRLSAVL